MYNNLQLQITDYVVSIKNIIFAIGLQKNYIVFAVYLFYYQQYILIYIENKIITKI